MAFESLTDRLAGVFKKLRGHGKLTEADIKAAMREVRMALLEADVNYKVAKDFCAKVSNAPKPKTGILALYAEHNQELKELAHRILTRQE